MRIYKFLVAILAAFIVAGPAMVMAVEDGVQNADAALNAKYQAVMKLLPEDQKDSLRTAQRAWITFRDDACSFESSLKHQNRCVQRLTLERLAHLQEYFEFLQPSDATPSLLDLIAQFNDDKESNDTDAADQITLDVYIKQINSSNIEKLINLLFHKNLYVSTSMAIDLKYAKIENDETVEKIISALFEIMSYIDPNYTHPSGRIPFDNYGEALVEISTKHPDASKRILERKIDYWEMPKIQFYAWKASIGAFGPKVVTQEKIQYLCSSQNDRARVMCMEILWESSYDNGQNIRNKIFSKALNDVSPGVRRLAVQYLGGDSNDVVPKLFNALKDDSAEVRDEASYKLSNRYTSNGVGTCENIQFLEANLDIALDELEKSESNYMLDIFGLGYNGSTRAVCCMNENNRKKVMDRLEKMKGKNEKVERAIKNNLECLNKHPTPNF